MAAEPTQSDDFAPIATINVTPFVDVVLVLLVIFMVTAPMIMRETIGLKLPKTMTSDGKTAESLGIAITRQGQILVNGAMLREDEIRETVANELKKNENSRAIISADVDAKHGDVIRAIDILKSAGLQNFAFQIERESP